MNNAFYFPHENTSMNHESLLELRAEFGWEGYGLYWAIQEIMSQNEDGYLNRGAIGGLSVTLNVTKEFLERFIDYAIELKLFVLTPQNTYSSRRIYENLEKRKKMSESGKKGAENRWKNGGANRVPIGGANAKGEERKGKEIKKEKLQKEKKGDSTIVSSTEKTTEPKVLGLPEDWQVRGIEPEKIFKNIKAVTFNNPAWQRFHLNVTWQSKSENADWISHKDLGQYLPGRWHEYSEHHVRWYCEWITYFINKRTEEGKWPHDVANMFLIKNSVENFFTENAADIQIFGKVMGNGR